LITPARRLRGDRVDTAEGLNCRRPDGKGGYLVTLDGECSIPRGHAPPRRELQRRDPAAGEGVSDEDHANPSRVK
jgi:hypothetical protein